MKLSLIKNFVSLTTAEMFSKVITFAAYAYLARLFGPAGFGLIEWAGTVLMCGSLIVDQGFSAYGAREIARNPSDTSRLVSEVVTARFLLAGLGYAAIAIFAIFFVREAAVAQLLLIYGLSLWALPLLLQWVFQGHDRMHFVGTTQIIRQVIFVVTVFLFIRHSNDLIWVGVAEIAAVGAAAAFSLWAYRRFISNNQIARPALSADLFREGTPIGLSQMFWVVKMFGATFIVGMIATAEETGYFAGAMRIYIALHTFVWIYYFNMLPSFSRAWQHGPEQLAGMIRGSLRTVTVAALFGGIIWIAAAHSAMTIAYGGTFLPGGAALQWLAGACIAAAISGNYRFGLIAAGKQGKEMIAMAIGTAAAVILLPIGYYNAGIGGAAAALFVAELVVLASAMIVARNSIYVRSADRFPVKESALGSLPGAIQ